MKKLVMMASAVALCGVASAATLDWKVTVPSNADRAHLFMFVASSDMASAQSILNAGGASTYENLAAVAVTDSSNNTYAWKTGAQSSNKGGSNDGFIDDGTYNIIIFGTGTGSSIVNNMTYDVYSGVDLTGWTYDPTLAEPESSPGQLVIALTNYTKTSGTVGAVPEPTSGLLLLLGVAGLALRRRRA